MRRLLLVTLSSPLLACVPPGTTTAASPAARQQDMSLQQRVEQLYKPDTQSDEFSKVTLKDVSIYGMASVGGYVDCATTGSRRSMVSLYLRRAISPPADTTVYLLMGYGAKTWLFIPREGGLAMLLDADPVSFTAVDEPRRDVGESGYIAEQIGILLTREELRRITSATQVKVRVAGEKGRCDFVLPQESIELARLFVQREMGDEPRNSTSPRAAP